MRKPARQHLFHRRIVIGTLDCLDAEFSVIAALWPAVLVNHHRTHGLHTACIGDIVRLHAPDAPDSNKLSNLVDGPDGAKLLFLNPFLILGQHQGCIPGCQLHQAFLLSLFRNHQPYLLSPFGGQPLADDLLIPQRMLEPQFPWNKWCACIELLYKAVQNFALIFRRGSRYMKMVPANQLTLPDEEHLYHRVSLIPGHGHDVPVLHAAAGNLLLLRHLLHAV